MTSPLPFPRMPLLGLQKQANAAVTPVVKEKGKKLLGSGSSAAKTKSSSPPFAAIAKANAVASPVVENVSSVNPPSSDGSSSAPSLLGALPSLARNPFLIQEDESSTADPLVAMSGPLSKIRQEGDGVLDELLLDPQASLSQQQQQQEQQQPLENNPDAGAGSSLSSFDAANLGPSDPRGAIDEHENSSDESPPLSAAEAALYLQSPASFTQPPPPTGWPQQISPPNFDTPSKKARGQSPLARSGNFGAVATPPSIGSSIGRKGAAHLNMDIAKRALQQERSGSGSRAGDPAWNGSGDDPNLRRSVYDVVETAMEQVGLDPHIGRNEGGSISCARFKLVDSEGGLLSSTTPEIVFVPKMKKPISSKQLIEIATSKWKLKPANSTVTTRTPDAPLTTTRC